MYLFYTHADSFIYLFIYIYICEHVFMYIDLKLWHSSTKMSTNVRNISVNALRQSISLSTSATGTALVYAVLTVPPLIEPEGEGVEGKC
jgi:hypothetical protein